jgi:hypothetical protein
VKTTFNNTLPRTRHWLVLGLLAMTAGVSAPARADLVTDWNAVAASTIAPPGNPAGATPAERVPVYAVDLATFQVALYDTIVAFEGGYDPFASVPNAPLSGASFEAAVNEAAYRILVALYPSRSSFYLSAYTAKMAGIAGQGSTAIGRGQAVGADVANQILAWRANDGRETSVDITEWTNPGPTVAGRFQTPNALALVGRTTPSIRPFTLRDASQFRPQGPPALDSEEYAEDYAEVQSKGVEDARSSRSADEDALAKFHTEAPPLFWPRNLRRLASMPHIVDNARLLAAVWVAHADATIGCFEAKYHFRFWRPRTAIPNGAIDGNADTLADTSWLPNEPTPNHPEYPAAHSCSAGASMEVVRQLYGTKHIDFTMDSTAGGGVLSPMNYHSTDDFVKDIKDARVFGGMHFRTSTDDGTSLGRRVAKWVLKYRFRPLDEPVDRD